MHTMKRALFILALLLMARSGQAAGCTGTGSCFWVVGAGNVSSVSHWATTSGGVTTGGLPTAADDCIFDSLSNAVAYTVTVNATLACKSLTFAAPLTSGDVTFAGASSVGIGGNLTTYATLIRTLTGGIVFNGTSGTQTITNNGITWASAITVNNSGATLTNADAFTTTGACTLTAGAWTFGAAVTCGGVFTNTAGNLNTGSFAVSSSTFSSGGSGTRTLTLGSSTWTITGSGTPWSFSGATNLTIAANTAIVNISAAAGAIVSSGSSLNWNGLGITFAGSGSGAYTINSSGFGFGIITVSNTGAAPFLFGASAGRTIGSMIFAAGYTGTKTFSAGQTIGTLQLAEPDSTLILASGAYTITTALLSGTAGHPNILSVSGATNAGFTTVGGAQTLNYVTLSKITCAGGGQWVFGANSVDAGNNGGCTFILTNRKPLAFAGGL